MIMMGPRKSKGAMLVSIMEKMKKPDHFEEGKESNKDLMEKGGHDSAYMHYKAEVDAIFEALGESDKEKFSKALKGFVMKCVSKDKEEDKY